MLSCLSNNTKRSIHISPTLNILLMEARKRSAEDIDPEDKSAAAVKDATSKKQKVETDKPKPATTGPGKTKEESDLDPRVANVPVFASYMQFPDQLWELLKHDELKEAIWWLPGNDAFAINEPVFSELLLESHFRGNRFTSIIRKLNRW